MVDEGDDERVNNKEFEEDEAENVNNEEAISHSEQDRDLDSDQAEPNESNAEMSSEQFDPNDLESNGVNEEFDPNDLDEEFEPEKFDPNEDEEKKEGNEFDPNETDDDIESLFDPNDKGKKVGEEGNKSDKERGEEEKSEEAYYENISSESANTVLVGEIKDEMDESDQDELEREIEKEIEEGVEAINKYLEEEAEFINAYQEMVGKARELDEEREGNERQMTDDEWEKEVETAAYTAEQLYESMEEIETNTTNEEISEIKEGPEIEKKVEQSEEISEHQQRDSKEETSELYEELDEERDELEQHQVEATIEEELETEPEPIVNEKEVEKLQELELEEQFQTVQLNEYVEELVEKQEEETEQLKDQEEIEELEAQTSDLKEETSELYEELDEERDGLEQHQVEATIEEELETEPEPIVNEKEVEKLQELELEEQFQTVQLNEYVEELVEKQEEDKNIENDKIEQEKENIERTQEIIHQSTYLQEKLEAQDEELEWEYEEKDGVEQHQVEAAIEEELKTESKPTMNEEELEYIKNLEPEKQLEAEFFYEFIEELANKQNEEKEEREENEEHEEISTEQKVAQIMRELDIAQEKNSGETEVENNSQKGELEQETTSPDEEVVKKLEIEEKKDREQELEEILEQIIKIEQEALKEIEQKEKDSDKTIEKKYERAKKIYRQQTGKRPIYANNETQGFKQWLEQKKKSEEKEKTKQKKKLKEEQKKEETWKWLLRNWIGSATEIDPELKSELKKLVEEYDELEKLIKKYSQLYNKAHREKLSQAEKNELKSLIKALQKIDPIKIELFLGVREIKRYLDEQHFFDFWNKQRVNRIRHHFFTKLSQIYNSLKQAQKRKGNSEEIIKNWIEQASEEEISLELKVKLKEIAVNYSELNEFATMFMRLYTNEQREDLSKHEKQELKSLKKTLLELEPDKIELFTSIRAIKNYLNEQNLDDFSDKKRVNQILDRFFTHLSQKNNKLNKIPKSHQDIETSKEKRKKCRRCHKILSYNKFEKYGSERGKKGGKQSYRTLCKNCRREVKSIRALRKKLRLMLELFGGICNNCHTGLIFLPSFEFHHTEKVIKNLSWRKISQNSYQTLKNWAINEKVTPLCGNCHSKEQAKYYKEFKNLILKKNLFKFSQEEIEELINVSIRNHQKFKNSKIKSKIKYQIKRWIRKRFVIEQLYNGKCIVCGSQADENLPSMIFHHRNEKQKTLSWKDLRDLECVEILKSLISENCVCICLNCHGVLHSTFNSNIEEILKGIFTENEINKFSLEIHQILNRINNTIKSFKFNLETINFISPLKYAIDQNDIWKIKMLKIFSYLEKNEFRTKDIMSLCNNNYHNAYEIISKLVEKEFLFRAQREGFSQNYYKFSEEGIKKVKELQQTYDFHEDLKSLDNEQMISSQRMENDDILEKYPKIIKSIIKNKGCNEFTVKDLAEAIGKSTVNISRNLREKMIPNGYVKVKNSHIITKKHGSTKVYYLTDKTEIL